ncbi:MAG: DUF6132 family protein [Phycisphaeraceae bacterium]
MLIKTIVGIALFALVGAAVGYSKVLCPDGGCAITGTSYGGAIFGGVLGIAVMSGLNNRATPTDRQADDERD